MELRSVMGYLKERKCSCDPKTRSGSSRTDDTIFPSVCWLPTAFSRNRVAGHPSLFFPPPHFFNQVVFVCHNFFYKSAQGLVIKQSTFPATQDIRRNISQLNQIARARIARMQAQVSRGMKSAIAAMNGGFKLLNCPPSLNFFVIPKCLQGTNGQKAGHHTHCQICVGSLACKIRLLIACAQNRRPNLHPSFSCRLQEGQCILWLAVNFVSVKLLVACHAKFWPQVAANSTPCFGIGQSRYASYQNIFVIIGIARPIATGIQNHSPLIKQRGIGAIKGLLPCFRLFFNSIIHAETPTKSYDKSSSEEKQGL